MAKGDFDDIAGKKTSIAKSDPLAGRAKKTVPAGLDSFASTAKVDGDSLVTEVLETESERVLRQLRELNPNETRGTWRRKKDDNGQTVKEKLKGSEQKLQLNEYETLLIKSAADKTNNTLINYVRAAAIQKAKSDLGLD